jgi:thiol:disulfide interchange protein DsbD
VVPAVGTGTVMEDALEPSLGASNMVLHTEKAWSQRLNQLQKEVCGQSFYCFFIGFAALLTPVFSMIPMTVSFTKQSKTKRKALAMRLYGFNYCYLCSSRVLVTWIFADLNALSTNVWFNIIFFVLLVVFAASFLGAFEIMLPNSWANKVIANR